MDKIKRGTTSLFKVRKEQEKFKSSMGEIKEVQKDIHYQRARKHEKNIENLYEAINFYDNFTTRASEARNQARQEGEGLKTLTPKQMLQRLPIALAQIKVGNNSESLLNETRQIVYSLYQPK